MSCSTKRMALSLMMVMTGLSFVAACSPAQSELPPSFALGAGQLTRYHHSECNTLLIQPCVDRYAHMRVPTGTINTYQLDAIP